MVQLDLSRAVWRKSSYSNGQGGACVEITTNLPAVVAVRDSKDPQGPALTFTPRAWHAFIRALSDGQLR